ncbi:hypothetical protein FocTR4_00004859 [Fusarium oxysporum f. sp. cubense]|uniref:Uncharacterized protein n=1 Tax=Fusarium oxysporum f. sp. cubense TaxID=61366 RepID=A0A5C6TFY5_FUSOC|nr:hypothetical protein FocTR4_00004859 [Fusarium oxysporum f. sp. cubense]
MMYMENMRGYLGKISTSYAERQSNLWYTYMRLRWSSKQYRGYDTVFVPPPPPSVPPLRPSRTTYTTHSFNGPQPTNPPPKLMLGFPSLESILTHIFPYPANQYSAKPLITGFTLPSWGISERLFPA